MGHEPFEQAAALEAVGALEAGERQALAAHLRGCAQCRAALAQYRQAAAALPLGLPPATPPPTLKSQLLAAFRGHFGVSAKGQLEAQAMRAKTRASFKPERRWTAALLPQWLGPSFAVASLALLIVTGLYALSLRSQLATESAERQRIAALLQEGTAHHDTLQQQLTNQEQLLKNLRAELTNAQGDLRSLQEGLLQREAELAKLRPRLAQGEREAGTLRAALAQRDEILTILRSTHVKVVSLAGLQQAKSAGAFLLYDRGTKKAFFYAFNMPPLPAGKTYQLWAIVDKPVSAGTFHTDPGQTSRLLIRNIPPLESITKFAVSVEPQGGRPQPTGEIYLVGQL